MCDLARPRDFDIALCSALQAPSVVTRKQRAIGFAVMLGCMCVNPHFCILLLQCTFGCIYTHTTNLYNKLGLFKACASTHGFVVHNDHTHNYRSDMIILHACTYLQALMTLAPTNRDGLPLSEDLAVVQLH